MTELAASLTTVPPEASSQRTLPSIRTEPALHRRRNPAPVRRADQMIGVVRSRPTYQISTDRESALGAMGCAVGGTFGNRCGGLGIFGGGVNPMGVRGV
jgi:hypothetical protein